MVPEQAMVSNAMYRPLAMVILVAARSFNAIIALLARLGRYGCGLVVVLGNLRKTACHQMVEVRVHPSKNNNNSVDLRHPVKLTRTWRKL